MQGGVKAIAVDQTGHHMATSGVDSEIKIWDMRTFKPLHTYFSHAPAINLEISQKGHLAVSFGTRLQVPCLHNAYASFPRDLTVRSQS